jgi:hypothetical protein
VPNCQTARFLTSALPLTCHVAVALTCSPNEQQGGFLRDWLASHLEAARIQLSLFILNDDIFDHQITNSLI